VPVAKPRLVIPAAVRVGLLGPVEIIVRGRAVALPQLAKRVLVAALAVTPHRTVSVRELIDTIWREDVTRRRIANLHSHVSQLRQRLREAGADTGLLIMTQPPGYQLALIDASTDVDELDRLVDDARAAMRAGDPAAAAARYRQALRLWRGPSLADVAEVSPVLRGSSYELEERRLAILDARVEADLMLGLHRDLIGELSALVSQHPFRERPRCQLMLCLYRSGRRVEALDCYQDARRLLADRLGLDPGSELARLQGRILRSDPALDSGLISG
jgi:DNA-binding SARP family transcriptional activator